MADNLGYVVYVLGYLGDQDVLMVVAGHGQEYVGMVDAAFLEIILHHGLCSEHYPNSGVGSHILQAVALGAENGDLVALNGQVCHQTGAESVAAVYQDPHS